MNPVYMKERQAPSNPFKHGKSKTLANSKTISAAKGNVPASLICVKMNENPNVESESMETNQGSRATKRQEITVEELAHAKTKKISSKIDEN